VLAQRLRTLSPRIDEIVAAQLWIEIRTFPWRRLRKVAANILANTRTGVLRECGAHRQIERVDRTWSSVRLVDPTAVFWTRVCAQDDASHSAVHELAEVLEWARAVNAISDSDRSLLLSLAETADCFGPARTGRSRPVGNVADHGAPPSPPGHHRTGRRLCRLRERSLSNDRRRDRFHLRWVEVMA
jgi:hypothetical protein